MKTDQDYVHRALKSARAAYDHIPGRSDILVLSLALSQAESVRAERDATIRRLRKDVQSLQEELREAKEE